MDARDAAMVEKMLIAEAAANARKAAQVFDAAEPGTPEWNRAGAELEFWIVTHDLLVFVPKVWH